MARMREQLQLMNASFDWTREFATCDPEIYKHTQKIFLLLMKHGLVSRKKATVNWDPVENTVLANEQVDANGCSWRSGAVVEQRELEQWFLHITDFKESLLRDLAKLGEDDAWPEVVLNLQKKWLGRSKGAYYRFPVSSTSSKVDVEHFDIFTTRPETIFAAQFLAISPNSSLADELAKADPELRDFLDRAKTLPHDSTEGYRLSQVRTINPLSLHPNMQVDVSEPLPVYVAPYVRGDYETAAVMGVPAHDTRDFAFWKRQSPNEPIKYAITTKNDGSVPTPGAVPIVAPGYMTSLAGEYEGKRSSAVAKEVVAQVAQGDGDGKLARATVKWKIRDWLISRQRYWGTPIPIIHCDTCGPQPVPDDQLPVRLPKVGHHWADGRTSNPLQAATDWIQTTCPKCHGSAKRDTDTMDTFMDSSWYYMRFPDPHNPDLPISKEAAEQYLPVDMYVGGVEHAVLHLLYARFVFKAVMGLLYPNQTGTPQTGTGSETTDIKLLATQSEQEPFKRLIAQGMVHGKTYTDPDSGRFLKPDEVDLSDPSSPKITASGKTPSVSFEKMSKSKYNGVDPGNFISKYGADATRAHILFQAPVADVLNWDEHKIIGVLRWLRRVNELVQTLALSPEEDRADWNWDARQHFSKKAEDNDNKGDQTSQQQQQQLVIDSEIWRTTQETIISVTGSMEKVYFLNTAVSDLTTLTNVLFKHAAAASRPVVFAATAHLVRMLAPIAPALAEECWSVLYPHRHTSSSSIFDPPRPDEQKMWPAPDGTLSSLPRYSNTVKLGVKVNGKLRCEVEIPAPAARPAHLQQQQDSNSNSGPEFESWLTEEVLKNPVAQKKLMTTVEEGGVGDIRKAKKLFYAKNGTMVNYVV
ncbi:hypothetical protein SLS62_009835 [Diatrype stigma]|uniref:leucine--tRNA ligase n=1 Tax=Diatrype stigma TaxID=117547 RepID=A0AAN9YIF9_9PEZI